MIRLPWIGALSVLLVTCLTTGLVLLGPPATVPSTSETLFDAAKALHEPTDRLVLLAWFAVAALLTTWGFLAGRTHPETGRLRQVFGVAIGVCAVALALLAITWSWDSTTMWPGISTQDLLIGTLLFTLIIVIWWAPRLIAIGASITASAVVLTYVAPLWIQFPGSLRDSIHFAYVADEYAAAAAGRTPLGDYFPTYVNLLGYPIAPLLNAMPDRATLLIAIWMMLLQAVALIVLVALPTWLAGWRMIAPAIVVGVSPLFATSELWQSNAAGYSPVSPSRQILPALLLLATFAVFRRASVQRVSLPLFTLLGILGGLTLLNNADFGSAAAVISLFGMLLLPAGQRLRGFLGQILGMLVVFLTYALLGLLVGQSVNWLSWSLFARVVGLSGFNAVAMRPFGLHAAVVALFITLFAVGLILTLKFRSRPRSFASLQGFLLFLTAGWGLLTLPYFAGRSLTPTLTGGFAFTVGLVVASALPLFRAQFAGLARTRARHATGPAVSASLAALVLVSTAATFALVPNPSKTLSELAHPSNDLPELIELRGFLNEAPANSAHILPMSSLLELQTGMPALNVTNHPFHLALSPAYTKLLCQSTPGRRAKRLITTPEVLAALQLTPTCSSSFDFSDIQELDAQGKLYVVVGIKDE